MICGFPLDKQTSSKSKPQVQNIITAGCQQGYVRVHGKCVRTASDRK
ncbi:hypothetical protein TcasGA2_TC032812 [Tribolium castaneum]|uniref:Uncharacterized protein n=1 Tax=Tribolium castaneum TaxID=7070 RepID=A0A139WIW5_TRICA|nr:hypothetical protein TcasGA2_TC032812 [Tribolium castaneum]